MHRVDLTDVHLFALVPYAGVWDSFTAGPRWLNGNLYMLEVVGRTEWYPDFPSTMCFRPTAQRLVEGLNTLICAK